MVFTLNIKTDWLEDMQQQYWSNVVKDFMNTAIKKSIIILEWEAKKETPVDRWQLRASFQTRFTDLKWVLYNPSKYALFVQYGTKPHTPPRKPIEEYANRKGINPWALRYSIKRKGTKANDYLWRSIQKAERKIDRVLGNTANLLITKLNR